MYAGGGGGGGGGVRCSEGHGLRCTEHYHYTGAQVHRALPCKLHYSFHFLSHILRTSCMFVNCNNLLVQGKVLVGEGKVLVGKCNAFLNFDEQE